MNITKWHSIFVPPGYCPQSWDTEVRCVWPSGITCMGDIQVSWGCTDRLHSTHSRDRTGRFLIGLVGLYNCLQLLVLVMQSGNSKFLKYAILKYASINNIYIAYKGSKWISNIPWTLMVSSSSWFLCFIFFKTKWSSESLILVRLATLIMLESCDEEESNTY